ncbi:MAG: hypothetical protein ABS882_09630 [Lysinibacillus sp.]
MLRLAHLTSVVSAIFTALLLKGLHLFEFIKWRPTGFLKVIDEPFFRYIVLALIIYVLAFLLYLVATVIRHSSIAAVFIALLVVIIVECVLMDRKIEWAHITISFFVLTLLNCRFIMETAFFHKRQNIRENRESS